MHCALGAGAPAAASPSDQGQLLHARSGGRNRCLQRRPQGAAAEGLQLSLLGRHLRPRPGLQMGGLRVAAGVQAVPREQQDYPFLPCKGAGEYSQEGMRTGSHLPLLTGTAPQPLPAGNPPAHLRSQLRLLVLGDRQVGLSPLRRLAHLRLQVS